MFHEKNNLVIRRAIHMLRLRATSRKPGFLRRSYCLHHQRQGSSITYSANFFQEVNDALAEGGTEYALQFMHPIDNPKIDSLDRVYACTIGRTSNKIRNVANKPDGPEELALIEAYINGKVQGDTVLVRNDHVIYYQPILLSMPACLQCHGQPGVDITESTLAAIRTLYPDDQATGYKLGDVRGLWKVSFKDKAQ